MTWLNEQPIKLKVEESSKISFQPRNKNALIQRKKQQQNVRQRRTSKEEKKQKKVLKLRNFAIGVSRESITHISFISHSPHLSFPPVTRLVLFWCWQERNRKNYIRFQLLCQKKKKKKNPKKKETANWRMSLCSPRVSVCELRRTVSFEGKAPVHCCNSMSLNRRSTSRQRSTRNIKILDFILNRHRFQLILVIFPLNSLTRSLISHANAVNNKPWIKSKRILMSAVIA